MFIDQSLENFCAKVLSVVIVCSFHVTHDPGLPCTYTTQDPCRDRCVYRGPDGCVRSDGDAACQAPLNSRLKRRHGTSSQHVAQADRAWPMWGYVGRHALTSRRNVGRTASRSQVWLSARTTPCSTR